MGQSGFAQTHPATLQEDLDLTALSKSTWTGDTVVEDTLGKTVFGAWVQTRPGDTSTLTFRYLLPPDISPSILSSRSSHSIFDTFTAALGFPSLVRHEIFVQAQSGVEARTTTYTFDPGPALAPVVSSPTKTTFPKKGDGFFGMILEAK